MAGNEKKYKLSSVLKSLARDKRTGTLICIGEDTVQGRIYMLEGRLVSARCRNFQGKAAIDRINQNLLVSLKFHKNNNLVTLEDDADITEQNEPADKPVSEDEFKSLVDISSLAQDAEDKSLEAPLTAAIKDVIIEELTESLGPVAEMFVSDLDKDITLLSALNMLAREIDDLDAGIEFINNVKARI